MLDSVLEFFNQAASSSAFIFCFCNVIIVIILLDLKPSLNIHQPSEIPHSMVANQKQEITNSKCVVEKDTASLAQPVEVSHVEEAEAVDNIEIEGSDDYDQEEEKEEEEDDELRRRVEEFIEKVNKGWKEELLSTSSLV